MALLYSPSTTQPAGGLPTLQAPGHEAGALGSTAQGSRQPARASEAKWEAPGKPAAPAGPLCPGDMGNLRASKKGGAFF